jgi:glycosyltransferase involved in cell wall biosynthesis
LINAEFDVFLLARDNNEKEKKEVVDGVNVIRIGNKYGVHTLPVPKNPVWSNAIKNAIKEIRPDLIIVREIMIAEAPAKLGKKYSIPVIMDMAENYPACMRSWHKYNSTFAARFLVHKLKIPDLVEKRSVALCDGIIVVCEEQIERLQTQYNYNKENIGIVHNTPLFDDFKNIVPSIVNTKNKINDNIPIRFCNHGFLSAEKPITNFLLGFESVANKYNIEFVIAGIGEMVDVYKQLISNFKSKDKIKFTGKFNLEELVKIFNGIDIGVVPFPADDQTNYTIQNKIFDYMFAGKPVLTGKSNPLVRVMEETKAGLALDFSTPESSAIAIETMLLSDTETMSKNGMEAVKNKYN